MRRPSACCSAHTDRRQHTSITPSRLAASRKRCITLCPRKSVNRITIWMPAGSGALRRWCALSRPLTWAAMRMPNPASTSGMLPRRSAPTISAFMRISLLRIIRIHIAANTNGLQLRIVIVIMPPSNYT
ncbi:hypothetical protein ebA4919 [Aromatoleum aromaticum EbN1]|uniref:Uncharacterized protein n=1 Tax=Aromatoleum aromaticum (strain DSM 19018 / LMG 30748 / EbN1) TaxID=76114 RepID=Q5P190_AROAE|nr:hypothetical protein ebA4919 [Aromatoleum aromaticum EbN1]